MEGSEIFIKHKFVNNCYMDQDCSFTAKKVTNAAGMIFFSFTILFSWFIVKILHLKTGSFNYL